MTHRTWQLVLKALLALLLAGPLLWLVWQVALEIQQPGSALGADPGEVVVLHLGEWALRVLLVAFSISPLRKLAARSGWGRSIVAPALARSRRMTGLFAYTYLSLHLLAYTALFLGFSLPQLWEDLADRAYITVGFAAFVILSAMALTSTRGWQRRLGKRWQQLHNLVAVALGLALVHLWWLTRDGFGEVTLYTVWFGLLLALRYWPSRRASAHPAVA